MGNSLLMTKGDIDAQINNVLERKNRSDPIPSLKIGCIYTAPCATVAAM